MSRELKDLKIENLRNEIKKIEWQMLYTKQGEEMEKLEKRKEVLQQELLKFLVK
jgi:hypothetical protein